MTVAALGRPSGRALAAASAVALALAALWALARTEYGPLLHHGLGGGEGHVHAAPALALVAALVGWTLMVVAMMLPSAVPLIDSFGRTVAGRPGRRRLHGFLLAGFLGVWGAAGLAFLGGDLLVDGAVDRVGWLAERPHVPVAAALALAGAYQLSGLKGRCLTRCRSPRSFLYQHWTGGPDPTREALAIGLAYGRSCLGCCWPLMAVMLAVGAGSLGLMLALGAVMAAETGARLGPRLTAPLAVLLFAAAAAILLAGEVPSL